MTIQWDDNLLTGVDEVDNQHKEMFSRIINLLDAGNKGKGREEVMNTFSFLEDYIISHFKSEESIMHKYHFSDYTSHIAEHDQFRSVCHPYEPQGCSVANISYQQKG